MALKFKFKSKDEVPAEHLPLYTEREGAWLLDVGGAVERTALDEIRNSNAALSKERDELKQRFDGANPDEVRTLLAEKQKLEHERHVKVGESRRLSRRERRRSKGELQKQIQPLTLQLASAASLDVRD